LAADCRAQRSQHINLKHLYRLVFVPDDLVNKNR